MNQMYLKLVMQLDVRVILVSETKRNVILVLQLQYRSL